MRLALVLLVALLSAGRGACNGERAAAGRERDASLAEGEREGRGALHLSPRGRTPPPRARVGRDQRPCAVGRHSPGAVPLGLRRRLGKYRNGKYWRSFKNRCRPYGRRLYRCSSPHARPRRDVLDGAGVATAPAAPRLRSVAPHHANWEFHVAHFAGELPGSNSIPTGRDGRWQGVFGRYSYLGQPVFGTARPQRECRKTSTAAISTSTRSTPYGAGQAQSGILTKRHRDVLPQLRSPAAVRRLSQPVELRPAAPGERHRVTVGGPGVTPVTGGRRAHGSGPGPRRRVQLRVRSGLAWPATKSAPASGNEEAPWAIRGGTRATRPRTAGTRGRRASRRIEDAFDDPDKLDEDESLDDGDDDR